MPRVAVLASHSLLRAGLVSLLKSSGFEMVEEGATADDLIRSARGEPLPNILLANLAPNATDISDLMKTIKLWAPTIKVVFLSACLDVMTLSECFAAGASGYFLENISAEALQKSLKLVSAGENVFPSELASVLIESLKRNVGSKILETQGYDLSAREISILRLLSDGRSNKVIAATLNIAESTTKLHLRNILRKLRATNRTQAALWAVQRRIVPDIDNDAIAARAPEHVMPHHSPDHGANGKEPGRPLFLN